MRERVLVGAEVFLAMGAIGGAIGLMTGGIDLGTAADDLPWQSPVLGGIALLVLNGALPLAAAGGSWRHARWAPPAHVLVGAVLAGWIVVQVALIGLGSWLQVGYFAFGVALAALAVRNLLERPAGVRLVQRWVLNPPIKAAAWLGWSRRHVVVETFGRRTGRRRRTVVGMQADGTTGWIVAERGRHAGYVQNLIADRHVRVRVGGRWCDAEARIVDADDAQARLDTFGDPRHAAAVRRFGTDLLSIRLDFRAAPVAPRVPARWAAFAAASAAASALYVASDAIETVQGGFSTGQLLLTLVAEAAVPFVVLGLAVGQRDRLGRAGWAAAVAYAYAYVFFTGTVVFALVADVADYDSLSERVGAAMFVHGAVMVLAGVVLATASAGTGRLPRSPCAVFALGVVLVAATQLAPDPVPLVAATVRALGLAGMATGLALPRYRR